MSGVEQAAAWLAIALALGALVAALAMLRGRSLFVMVVCLAAAAALGSGALVLLGVGDGALALGAAGVGFGPFVLLAGVLLSARTTKPPRRSSALVGLTAMSAGVAAAAFIAPELGAPMRAGAHSGDALWLGALVFAACAACAGLLGYGERGVLERRDVERDI